MPTTVRDTMRKRHDQSVWALEKAQRYLEQIENYRREREPKIGNQYQDICESLFGLMHQIRRLKAKM